MIFRVVEKPQDFNDMLAANSKIYETFHLFKLLLFLSDTSLLIAYKNCFAGKTFANTQYL